MEVKNIFWPLWFCFRVYGAIPVIAQSLSSSRSHYLWETSSSYGRFNTRDCSLKPPFSLREKPHEAMNASSISDATMAVRALKSSSLFRSSSPPLSSALGRCCCRLCHFSSLQLRRRFPELSSRRSSVFSCGPHFFNYGGVRSRSVQSLIESVMEELKDMRKSRTVSANSLYV